MYSTIYITADILVLFKRMYYKKRISRSDRRTLPPEPRHCCKTLLPLCSISAKRSPLASANHDFCGTLRLLKIDMLRLIDILTYLLISFLLTNICGTSME